MGGERESRALTIEAAVENLTAVNAFVEELLEQMACPMKIQLQIEMAVEEIFVNIASYAYAPKTGAVTIRGAVAEDPLGLELTFEDSGIPYDPLAKADPDVTISLEERDVGGLGIFLVKKIVDDIHYEYEEGKNILTIRKNMV